MTPFRLLPGGLVENFGACLRAKHKTFFDAIRKAWQDLFNRGILQTTLDLLDANGQDVALSLEDVTVFLFTVEQQRKVSHKHAWRPDSMIGKALNALQAAAVGALSQLIVTYLITVYQTEHNVSKAPPARTMGRVRLSAGEDNRRKTSVAAETVWEIMEAARAAHVSAPAAMQMNARPALSNATEGANKMSIVPWQRKKQIIY